MVRSILVLLVLLLPLGAVAFSEEEAETPQPGWLGVSIEVAEKDGATHLVIGQVVEGSPAATAGLVAGDAILSSGGRAIETLAVLREFLTGLHAGDPLVLTVRRGEETMDVEVTLGVRPAPPTRGIRGKPAPAWKVDRWVGLAEGVKRLDVADLAGKVVYLYCFQSWCPGCHEHGFPTLAAVQKHYAGAKDVVFVVMQTVFEGFETNTLENGQKTLRKFKLDLPWAMSGTPQKRSEIMRAYNTGGTPWTILIDPKGIVRFDGFRLELEEAIEQIDGLRPPPPADEPDDE